jgi:hypothetical protein
MICRCCRRTVEFVRASFWHGDANICRECFSEWWDPNNDQVSTTDHVTIGNHIRLKYGLPPLAAVAILLLAFTSTAYASRHCLDQAEAARTWPARALTQDADGCWTYDHNPPSMKVPVSTPDEPAPDASPRELLRESLREWWLESELVQSELHQLELDKASHPEPLSPHGPNLSVRQLALFVSLVLATVSVLRVAAWRPAEPSRPPRWPPPPSKPN